MQHQASTTTEERRQQVHSTIIKWMWRLGILGILTLPILLFILSFSNLPSVEQLENPKSELASQVYANNLEVIGKYYTENRVPVSYDQLSPHLINALIATEDERYYEHCGIDFKAVGRAVVKTFFLQNSSSGGGSTITQQLAKQLFTVNPASGLERVIQKFKEWIIAVRLERKYTKEEIIAMYLNKFNFIHGAYGIKAASEIYFGKTQDSLELQEAATLIGMLKAPDSYDPINRPERAKYRRMVVLKQMEKNELITPEEYEEYRNMPIGVKYTKQTHVDGIAPYFRMELAKDVKRLIKSEELKKSDGREYNIYRDGLKIYTTIDPKMQELAEKVMKEHMAKVQNVFDRRWEKMDPWTYKGDSDHEISLEFREQSLNRLIRNSDRYQELRNAHLVPILRSLEEEVEGITFSEDDREVERIMKEFDQKGYIKRLVSRKIISSSRADKYRQILRSGQFSKLKTQWEVLQEKVEEAFSTPVEMTVFAYTTDKRMEKDTVMSPLDSIKYHRNFLQTGIMAVDPITGYVKVWVGGINHKYFQYDHVRTRRQVGSTFKPFLYATVIDKQGVSPCFTVLDIPVTIGPGDGSFFLKDPWTPKNAKGTYSGDELTLKEGLRQSKNTVSAYLMKQLSSPEPVRDLLDRMGIDKDSKYSNGRHIVPKTPSIALGSTDLTVLEMTGAYTTFANNGTYNRPIYIKRIEDKNGRILYEAEPRESPAINPNANFVMVEMLRYAATGLGEVKSPVGGKTGTTNDYVDGWFMGVTPRLVVGTWVGGEDRWIRFRSLTYGQGSYMAKPFFREFIKALEENSETYNYSLEEQFYRPSGDIGIEMDCDEYQREDLPLEGEFEDEGFSEDQFGDEDEFDDNLVPQTKEKKENINNKSIQRIN